MFLSPRSLYPLLHPQVPRPTFWGASRILSASSPYDGRQTQPYSLSSLPNLPSPPGHRLAHCPALAEAPLATCDHHSAAPPFPVFNTDACTYKGWFWKQIASNSHRTNFIYRNFSRALTEGCPMKDCPDILSHKEKPDEFFKKVANLET